MSLNVNDRSKLLNDHSTGYSSSSCNKNTPENSAIVSGSTHTTHNDSEADDPEAEEFVKKYGDIDVSFIEPPPLNPWFTKPYALNYFHNGRLYRTKHERTSGKLELFLDLVYVGIVSNLASNAIKGHDLWSLWKYILVFLPTFTIWSDIKELMNYYFNDDLIQRFFVVWEVILLVTYNSNCEFIDDEELGFSSLTICVICYSLGRISFAVLLLFYSRFIKEHNFQMKLFSSGLVLSCSMWFLILLIDDLHHKALFAGFMFILEQTLFCLSVHPAIKLMLKLEYSTALNIEHEDERYHAFFIISIGEFVFGLCSKSPLKYGLNVKLYKGIALVLISFVFLGFYTQKDGCLKAVHALRRSANSAMAFIYGHLVLIATMLIIGDSGADLVKIKEEYLNEEEFGILLYFHTGILISLLALSVIAYCDQDLDPAGTRPMNRYWRTCTRLPVGLLIFASSWLYEHVPLVYLLWTDCILLSISIAFEFTVIYSPANSSTSTRPTV